MIDTVPELAAVGVIDAKSLLADTGEQSVRSDGPSPFSGPPAMNEPLLLRRPAPIEDPVAGLLNPLQFFAGGETDNIEVDLGFNPRRIAIGVDHDSYNFKLSGLDLTIRCGHGSELREEAFTVDFLCWRIDPAIEKKRRCRADGNLAAAPTHGAKAVGEHFGDAVRIRGALLEFQDELVEL